MTVLKGPGTLFIKKSKKVNEIYYRYYNIYSNNELMEEIIRLKPEFKINTFGYEKGNYYIILEKTII